MPKHCINSITIEANGEQNPEHVINCFETVFEKDWIRRDAQIERSVRIFTAGIIGLFRVTEEVPMELSAGLGFTLVTYEDRVAKHFTDWLKAIHSGKESGILCTMLYRELTRSLPEWGTLTPRQKDDFKTLINLKGDDWKVCKYGKETNERSIYNNFFLAPLATEKDCPINPKASLRAFKPTDILKEINGKEGGLIKGIETADDYHLRVFETRTTDFICFRTNETSHSVEYIFETMDSPPTTAFSDFCKRYPNTKLTIVSLMKRASTCIRYELQGKESTITIDNISSEPDFTTDKNNSSIIHEDVVLRCPEWVYNTALIKIA